MMTKILDKTKAEFMLIIRLACAALILLMAAISVGVYAAPAADLLVMILFFIFYIQLPGLFIVRWAGVDRGHVSTALAMGAFAGWAAELLLYFINDLTGTDLILAVTGLSCRPRISTRS